MFTNFVNFYKIYFVSKQCKSQQNRFCIKTPQIMMIQTMWGNFAPHDKQISCLQTHSYKIINIVKKILWQVFLVTSFFALSFSENGCSGKIYVDDHYHCYEDKILHYGCCQKAQTAFTHGTRRWFLWNKIPHGWFLDF